MLRLVSIYTINSKTSFPYFNTSRFSNLLFLHFNQEYLHTYTYTILNNLVSCTNYTTFYKLFLLFFLRYFWDCCYVSDMYPVLPVLEYYLLIPYILFPVSICLMVLVIISWYMIIFVWSWDGIRLKWSRNNRSLM